jgi:uncharacterized protein
MIHYGYYSDVPDEVIDAFVRANELGRLVTCRPDGLPHIGLYPFVYDGHGIELHLHRADEQLADIRAQARCIFELDEVLGTIPSYWIDPQDAVMATAYHRTVTFECEASISLEADALAEQQARLMARYQPEGGFRVIAPEDPHYRAAFGKIAAIRLRIDARRVKFKLAQNRPVAVRRRIIEHLRARGRHGDARAADALQWTIDREESRE